MLQQCRSTLALCDRDREALSRLVPRCDVSTLHPPLRSEVMRMAEAKPTSTQPRIYLTCCCRLSPEKVHRCPNPKPSTLLSASSAEHFVLRRHRGGVGRSPVRDGHRSVPLRQRLGPRVWRQAEGKAEAGCSRLHHTRLHRCQ